MKWKQYILLNIFIHIGFFCKAQKLEINGTLQDSLHRPIASAFVRLVKVNQDTTTIAFASTNKLGKYKLIIPQFSDSLLLIAQHLGYERQTLVVLREKVVYDFSLTEKKTVLNEVIVRKVQPIKISKDTTSYKVNQFMDGSERNVEDILKKLPGIQVADNGDVTFKGKKIDKITIEGEDFFSKNYKLISKNMPSFVLDKVDAIENYNENPLLKGITKSDKTILNLAIKEDIKATAFGNLGIGGGVTNRYEANNTLFSLLPKLKIGQIGNANNTGFDAISEVEFSLQTKNTPLETTDFEASPSQFNVRETIASPNLSKNRFVANKANLLAINLSKKVSEKIKTKLWAYGFTDKTAQNYTNNTSYFLKDSILQIADYVALKRQPKLLKTFFEIEYRPKSDLLIKFQSNSLISTPTFTLTNENIVLGNKQGVQTNSNETNSSLLNSLEFTQKLSDTKALLGFLTFQNTKINNKYIANSNLYSFLSSNPIIGINQDLRFKGDDIAGKLRYIERRKRFFTVLSVDFKQLNNSIETSLLDSKNSNISSQKEYGSVGNYQKQSVSGEINTSWELRKWLIILGSSYHIGKVKSDFLPSTFGNNFKFLNKVIGIKFTPREGNTFAVIQSQLFTVSNLSDLAQGFYLANYRNFQQGTPLFNQSKSDVTMVSYSLIDMFRQLSFINKFDYVRSNAPYSTNTSINRTFIFVSKIPISGNNEYANFSSQIDKYVHLLRTRFKVEGDLGQSKNYFQVNSQPRRNIQNDVFYSGLLSTGFNFLLNAEIGYSKKSTKIKLSENEIQTYENSLLFAIIRLNSTGQLTGNLRFEYGRFNMNEVKNTTFFSDFWLSYKPKKSIFSWELIGRNIFNAQSVTSASFNGFYAANSTFALIPRIVEIKCEYRFGAKGSM